MDNPDNAMLRESLYEQRRRQAEERRRQAEERQRQAEERQRQAEESAVDDVLRVARLGHLGNKVWPHNELLGDVIAEGLEWLAGTSTHALLQLLVDAANGKDVKDAAEALIETCAQMWARMEVDVSQDD